MAGTGRVAAENLADVIRIRAEQDPEGVPFIWVGDSDESETEFTYGQLDLAARTVAAAISEFCSPGDRALLIYPPGLDFDKGFYGCLYGGVIGVPLAVPPLKETGLDRLAAVMKNSDASVVLTTEQLRERLVQSGVLPAERIIATDRLDPAVADGWRAPRITCDTVAYLQYSSGSTGAPKGVVLTHDNVLANNLAVSVSMRDSPEMRSVIWLPHFHDMGLLSAITQPVFGGYTCWRMSPMAFVQRPHRWLRIMSNARAHHTVAPNFAYELATRRVTDAQAEGLDLSTMNLAMCGAEPIRAEVLRGFAERFGPYGFRAEALYPCYGLAEATLKVTGGPYLSGMRTVSADPLALLKDRFEPAGAGADSRTLVSSGVQIEGLTTVIADMETLEPLPEGRIGGIFVSGDSVAGAYWDNKEVTDETFGLHLDGHPGEFMRTGDLGFFHDGHLYVTGRHKDLVIVDGSNHYPQDIEFTATDSHPALRSGGCAVFQVVDGDRTEIVLIAEIDRRYRLTSASSGSSVPDEDSPADDRSVTSTQLMETVRRAVGAAHGVRLDTVLFVRPRTLPLTTSGKIQRAASRKLYLATGLTDRLVAEV
ncbi:fatty acyl-AMP ligase [Streptomyces ipomoeae]|uniref:fatty acyl-AMP ligase n=1 Tax=Streptomyces ipomoeae TaxID=103232 RepID=UPI0015EFE8BA|nr:fatty acyl-AMP ligase [Streptomyces ipomoeae]MDX2939091.1 fatty acyl-AMP ligase [Streptomyces ipomoeae]